MTTQNSEQEKNYTPEEIYSMGLQMVEKLKAVKEERDEYKKLYLEMTDRYIAENKESIELLRQLKAAKEEQ